MKKPFLYLLVAIIALTALLLAGCSTLATTTGNSLPSASAASTGTGQPSASAAATDTTTTPSATATMPSPTTGSTQPTPTMQPTPSVQEGTVVVLIAGAAGTVNNGTSDPNNISESNGSNATSIMVTVTSVQVQMTGNTTTPSTNEAIIPTSTTPITSTTPTNSIPTEDATGAASENNWITLNLSGTTSFDLLQMKSMNGVLAAGNLASGKYNQIRMTVSRVQVSTSGDEQLQNANMASQTMTVMQDFSIAAGKTTTIMLNFDPSQSITFSADGSTIFDPVITQDVTDQ